MASYSTTIERYRTWSIDVQWKLDGTPVDLTGYTLKSAFSPEGADDSIIFTLLQGSGITIVDAVTGRFRLSLSASQTSQFPVGVIGFDVLAVSPGGDAKTVFVGYLNVSNPRTKS